MSKLIIVLTISIILFSCVEKKEVKQESDLEIIMNDIAKGYVKLVLRTGQYDPDFVDAYYGPQEWKPSGTNLPPDSSAFIELLSISDSLLNELEDLSSYKATELETLRYRNLYKQLLAVKTKIFMLNGSQLPFDQESKGLYDAVSPVYTEDYFQQAIDELNQIVPGKGSIEKRINEFKRKFEIPKGKIEIVFKVALQECRERTSDYITLPPGENFSVEIANNQPWGAYNWYKGNLRSVIQVNTDLPKHIGDMVSTAAHEGYPGHHLYNLLLEWNFVMKREWKEFSVYPLFSPQSLIAEGTANYAEEILFSPGERLQFEKEILYPLAGIDTTDAALYYNINQLQKKLGQAATTAAKNYLDGVFNREQTVKWLQKYQLRTKESAEKYVSFIEKYRSYVINYSLGEDMIREFIEKKGGSSNNLARSWELFELLISTPQTPSGLKIN
ncbi:MAG: hypothetical protein ACHQLA_01650 [Ignavibacteriales bacterium]